ncbi:50S ribosomal protein L21 [Iningainema sp. BLCCT55]|uniref:Large ribosomal subunit protein bL21 n=1 Tax=Iningainema tapete BLCC-T55 TaxID=2748662 RepID=A0A8J6XXI9_9CYAN|nr:50S ribosomal protein L21 [Iningainema tapete BLCC-T55]
MTYAIIETGGKQLKVEPGRFYDIELLSAQEDEKVTIQSVLLVQHNGEFTIGQPLVAGATVEGTVMRHLRGRKVIVYKMKPKKKTRKKRGHRQEITRLMIDSIIVDGTVLTSEQQTATDETQPEVTSTIVEPSAENATEPVASFETQSDETTPVAETVAE